MQYVSNDQPLKEKSVLTREEEQLSTFVIEMGGSAKMGRRVCRAGSEG